MLDLVVGFVPARAAPVEGTTAVSLVDDDRGAALFDFDGLRPGRIDSACVALSATGSPDLSSEVRLSAEVTQDDLAPYLMLTVERGNVGGFGDCASFSGEPVWSGTLAQMPETAVTGIPTGWRPALDPRVVYRFTVTVLDDPRAQQRAAVATFVWTLREAGPPGDGPGTPAIDAAGPVPEPGKPAATTSQGEGADPGEGDVIEAPPLDAGPSPIEQVGETVLALVSDAQFPLLLLAVMTAFLLLQGALDRRDPKLALARVSRDLWEFRPFPGAQRTETT